MFCRVWNTAILVKTFPFFLISTIYFSDAPDLTKGTENELTETDRELAVCLATPFEGNPNEMEAHRPLISFEASQEILYNFFEERF